jgi:hypothetical protein
VFNNIDDVRITDPMLPRRSNYFYTHIYNYIAIPPFPPEGRRWHMLIERIAAILKVEPYRLFKDETGEAPDENRETRDFLANLPDRVRRDLKKQLLAAISEDIDETLKP